MVQRKLHTLNATSVYTFPDLGFLKILWLPFLHTNVFLCYSFTQKATLMSTFPHFIMAKACGRKEDRSCFRFSGSVSKISVIIENFVVQKVDIGFLWCLVKDFSQSCQKFQKSVFLAIFFQIRRSIEKFRNYKAKKWGQVSWKRRWWGYKWNKEKQRKKDTEICFSPDRLNLDFLLRPGR